MYLARMKKQRRKGGKLKIWQSNLTNKSYEHFYEIWVEQLQLFESTSVLWTRSAKADQITSSKWENICYLVTCIFDEKPPTIINILLFLSLRKRLLPSANRFHLKKKNILVFALPSFYPTYTEVMMVYYCFLFVCSFACF